MTKTFTIKVLDIVRHIPVGTTLSYGEVANRAGNKRAARAVGSIMRQNFDPNIPCHRVICSDGRLGGYNRGGSSKKMSILKAEKKYAGK